MSTQKNELLRVIQRYFDALYFGRSDWFSEVFHAEARLFSSTDDEFIMLDLPLYLERVTHREAPAQRNDPRIDEIISLEMPTPTTAHVRVRDLYLPQSFVDDMTLIFLGDTWKIVSKVWHYEAA